jgi:hypothetical protein
MNLFLCMEDRNWWLYLVLFLDSFYRVFSSKSNYKRVEDVCY